MEMGTAQPRPGCPEDRPEAGKMAPRPTEQTEEPLPWRQPLTSAQGQQPPTPRAAPQPPGATMRCELELWEAGFCVHVLGCFRIWKVQSDLSTMVDRCGIGFQADVPQDPPSRVSQADRAHCRPCAHLSQGLGWQWVSSAHTAHVAHVLQSSVLPGQVAGRQLA